MTNRLKLWISALGLTLMLVGSSAHAAAPTTADEPVSETVSTTASGGGTSVAPVGARARGYAQREAAAPRAGDFKGNGAGIYIGGSTLAVVLVVVLVVVLL